MQLLELTCENFRCLEPARFRPGVGFNVIQGRNAQGKTSLLEALLFVATSKSHRTKTDSELVRIGSEGFRITVRVARHDREVVLEAAIWKGIKRFKVNGIAQTRISDILGKVNVVFFSPEEIELVRGSAVQRRGFMDMELSQLSSSHLFALQQYRQALRQRNELLRAKEIDEAVMQAWDQQLVTYGEVIMRDRAIFIEELAPRAAAAYAAIADGEHFGLAYAPDVRTESTFAETLVAARKSDLRQGLTTRGPHRDDFDVIVASKPARQFASQGQQRTAALAMKLAEAGLIQNRTGEYPILMLDDVLSELDSARAASLVDAIPDGAQCLITSTDQSAAALFGTNCQRFTIEAGSLQG